MRAALKRAFSFLVPHGFVALRDAYVVRQWKREQQRVHDDRLERLSRLAPADATANARPRFDYEEAVAFLGRSGCDAGQVREGSIDEASIRFADAHLVAHSEARELLGLHIGNFVGVSLAAFAYFAWMRHPGSLVVGLDPNITHRGIHAPQDKALQLLWFLNLQRNAMVITGYSLEKTMGNDGMANGHDPLETLSQEVSCELQLPALARLLPGRFDFCVIDGNHDAGYLRREIDEVDVLLKPKGRLLLDDIGWQWPDLQQAYRAIDAKRYTKVATNGRIGVMEKV